MSENLIKKGAVSAVALFALASAALCFLLLGLSRIFAPKGRSIEKSKTEDYECGLSPASRSHRRVSVRFFLTAILFIIFDIEIIFLYPFALAYRDFLQTDQALGVLLAMGLFLLIFIFGLWWEIKTKALNWK